MEHERRPELKERFSLAGKRDLIVELYRKNWNGGRRFPFMPEVVAADGSGLEKSTEAQPGSAKVENVEAKDGLIRSVRTGTGYIALGGAEMMTKELTGCMGVLVRGSSVDGKPLSALFHMTPTTKLAWGNFKRQDDEERWGHDIRVRLPAAIVESLVESGADLANCDAALIRTAGFPPNAAHYNGYTEDHQQEKTADLIKGFEAAGLKTNAVEPLPMETATIYWNPEAPDELLAVGEERIPNPQGGVDEPPQSEKTVAAQIVKI